MSRFTKIIACFLLVLFIGGLFLSCAPRRRRCPPGYHWVPGHYGPRGHWIGGHCAPNR
ncbi:MAG: hypothetical protein JRI46_02070 [Deltaproteobacteria bacterium]|nr:hypothetical protein [Deltaproteobacteria bacterium]